MTTPANDDPADGSLPAGSAPPARSSGADFPRADSSGADSLAADSPGTGATTGGTPGKQPSLVPGVVLLLLAGVLIVVTLLKPDLPNWLTVSIAALAIVVVVALLLYSFKVFRDITRPGGPA